MAVSAPPQKKPTNAPAPAPKSDEKKIDEIINRGSSTIRQAQPQPEQDPIRNFNVKLQDSQLRTIEELRAQRPKKPTSKKKIGISLQDWMIEAFEEKIKRERKQFNLG